MAKKKVVTKKKPVKKAAKPIEVPLEFRFRVPPEGASDDEILAIHQHNLNLLSKHVEILETATSLDEDNQVLAGIMARIGILERKIARVGFQANFLLAKKHQAEQEAKLKESQETRPVEEPKETIEI